MIADFENAGFLILVAFSFFCCEQFLLHTTITAFFNVPSVVPPKAIFDIVKKKLTPFPL